MFDKISVNRFNSIKEYNFKTIKINQNTYMVLPKLYNIMIEEYKVIVKDTSLDNPQSLNRRTSFYHIILDWHMDGVFKFKDTDKNKKGERLK